MPPIACCSGRPKFFRADAVATVLAAPWKLLVRYRGVMHDILFVVAHAPHETSEHSALDFWVELARDVRMHRGASACQLLMADANAQLRSDRPKVRAHAASLRGFLDEAHMLDVTCNEELVAGEAPWVS